MKSTVEANLWEAVGVKSVSELPDFPFPSHKAFIDAVCKGEATIGIEYQAARDLAHVTKSPTASYVLLALSWVPFLLMLASIIVAVQTERWAILVGIPTALIGMAVASPYNPLRYIALLGAIASMAYCLMAATVLTAGTWAAFTFALSLLVVKFINLTAWKWAHKSILRSEALTAYLWKTANLHINSKEFGMKSAALSQHQKGYGPGSE